MSQPVVALVNHLRFLPGVKNHQPVILVGQMIAAGDPPGVRGGQVSGNLSALRQIPDLRPFVGIQVNGEHLGLVTNRVADVLLPVRGEAAVVLIRHPAQLAGLHIGAVAPAVVLPLQLLLHEEEIAVVGGEILAGEIQLGVALRPLGIPANLVPGHGITVFNHGFFLLFL